jgi:RNA polymerase sigma factor for flagellar operon FliA
MIGTATGQKTRAVAPAGGEIPAYDPMSDLWRQYHADPDSGENLSALMQAYLPLVSRVLERISIHLPPHVAIEDLQQSAMLGLYQAIERYDTAIGQEFGRFAWSRIRGAVMDELRAMDHLSRGRRTQIKRVEAAVEAWMQDHGTSPSDHELAQSLDVSVAELTELVAQSQPLLSLHDCVTDAEGGKSISIMDRLADAGCALPSEEAAKEDMRRYLRKAFRGLSDREQKVLYLYYYEELRLSEIGALFEVTEARICQIHAMALIKLKILMERAWRR